jgi:hypothetical protein
MKLVQPDDERMLRSSDPAEPDLSTSHFVPADEGILAWHKLRRARARGQTRVAPSRRLDVVDATWLERD